MTSWFHMDPDPRWRLRILAKSQKILASNSPNCSEINQNIPSEQIWLQHGVQPGHLGSILQISELVQELARRGSKLGVVTSKRNKTAIPTLQHFGLLKHFPVIVTEDDVRVLKPDPEPILMTARGLGVDPGELLVVGDNPTDMMAARAAGCFGGAAIWGYYGNKVRELADLIFTKPSDVLDVCAQ